MSSSFGRVASYLLIGLFLVCCLGNVFADSSLLDGLVSYYNFDETSGTVLIDLKADSNGTNSNVTINQAGIIGKAYQFVGASSSTVTLANEANYDFLLNTSYDMTVCFWMKSSTTTDNMGLFNKGGYPSGFTMVPYSLGPVATWFKDGSNYLDKRDVSKDILNNQWNFICATRQGTTPKLYFNNVEMTTNSSAGTFTTVNVDDSVVFGNNNGVKYTGYLDEMGIWKKALSTKDLNELYNAGAGLTYPFISESVNANFDYVVDGLEVDLNDSSTVSGDAVVDSWEWLKDDVVFSTDQNTSFVGEENTDYNVCLVVRDSVLELEDSICKNVYVGDLTPPVTSFSSFQVAGTTDQNITLSCNDGEGVGCKKINYKIDDGEWNNIYGVDKNIILNPEGKSQALIGHDNFYLAQTIDMNNSILQEFNKVISFTLKLREESGYATGDAKAKAIYYYSDGTNEETNTVFTNGINYINHTLINSNVLKSVNKIEIYGGTTNPNCCTSSYNIADIIININITYPKSYFYSFLFSGVGQHSIQYYSTDLADNNEAIKSSGFTTYGLAKFVLFDENTGLALEDVTIKSNKKIGGVDEWVLSGTNSLLLDLQGVEAGTYLFTLKKTGFANRFYETNLNEFTDSTINFALIPTELATEIQFKMFPPTMNSVLANTFIEFKTKDTNRTITKLKSNEQGELTATLKLNDQNYVTIINDGEYEYQAVQLTIFYPKDEQTQLPITGNWRLEITDNISYQDLNIPASQNKIIYLLPNTKYPFSIKIQDVLGLYFKRSWAKVYQGNPLTDSLQPYLISADDGLAVRFVFQDAKLDPVEGIIINIYKNFSGVKTLVSSSVSDVIGNALFFLIAGDKYWLEFSYEGKTFFESENFIVASNIVYWSINLEAGNIQRVGDGKILVSYNPATDFVPKGLPNLGFKVSTTGTSLSRIKYEYYTLTNNDKNVLIANDLTCSSPCNILTSLEDLNVSKGRIFLDLIVYTDANKHEFAFKKSWTLGGDGIDIPNLFLEARTDFGCGTDPLYPCPLTSIISIIIAIMVIGGIVFGFNLSNPKGLLVIGLGVLGVLTYVGWFWWLAFVLMVVGTIMYLRSDD